ncbi:MAG: hypothetical protein QOK35_116 [Pseudonocardiales bacterium]|nr:hypothetical protein [Pseudonocardiales bacterium]
MWFRVGLVAIALAFVPWVMIAAAPLLGLPLGAIAGLVTGLLVVAEVLFWAGLALAGKDTWQTVKARGWRRAPRELGRLLVHGRPQAPGRESPSAVRDPHLDRTPAGGTQNTAC